MYSFLSSVVIVVSSGCVFYDSTVQSTHRNCRCKRTPKSSTGALQSTIQAKKNAKHIATTRDAPKVIAATRHCRVICRKWVEIVGNFTPLIGLEGQYTMSMVHGDSALMILAVRDSEETPEPVVAPPPPPSESESASRTGKNIEEAYAQRCKTLSHELYSSIDELASGVENGTLCGVSVDTARVWLSSLRELNVCLSKYARASVSRVDRLQVEIALAHNAMTADLLDREACHTTTLEALAAAQLLPGQGQDRHSQPASSSSDVRTGDSVERAMNLVMQLHSNTAPFTSEVAHGYFGAPRCTFPGGS